jgi:hypothetical protein
MPNKNAKGPMGMGPLTGRGLGPCNFGATYRRSGYDRGLGRYSYYNKPKSLEGQKQALIDYKKALQEELEDVEKEVQSLSN